MVLRSLVKKIIPMNKVKSHNMSSAKEFNTTIARERARSDRNGHGFSLAIFQFSKNVKSVDTQFVTDCIASQIRVSDEFGWYDQDEIGVLLYNTPSQGAWLFADNLRAVIDEQKILHSCSVLTYPDEWAGEDNGQTDVDIKVETGNRQIRNGNKSAVSLAEILPRALPTWKRTLDILGSLCGIALFSPIMLFTAIVVKLTSKGPVVFSQKRVGHGGKSFEFYKFRSMVVDAEAQLAELKKKTNEYGSGAAFKLKDDPRVTKIGKIIRKTSIDELPQFFNVLKGDMSLVGPRPLILSENAEIDKWHKMRADVKPGLTGIWQVYGRHLRDYDQRMRMDLKYVRTYSFGLDLKLLALTMPAIISQRGAF